MIGIFDSGVGGMTVAYAIEQAFPDLKLVYFGDVARTPYGSKSPDTIRAYTRENIEFLISKGAKLIVIACNSAASVVTEEDLQQFDLPIFDVITPAVNRVGTIASASKSPIRLGVIGTRATVKSGIYARKIASTGLGVKVLSQECPLLVPLVEEGWLNKRETKMILRRYLHPLKIRQVQALVLGCTHYPLLKPLIQPRIGKRVTIIDSSVEVASHLKEFFAQSPEMMAKLTRKGDSCFYVSDVTESAVATARKIFKRPIDLIKT